MKKKIAALMAAAAGGVLFWRRKDLKGRTEQVTAVARSASEAARRRLESRMTQRRVKYAEIGYLVHQAHVNPDAGDHQREIDGLLIELDALIAAADEDKDKDEDKATIDLTTGDSDREPAGHHLST